MAKLFLIPTSISNSVDSHMLLNFQLGQIKHLKYFIVETAKVARLHLKQLHLTEKLQDLQIQELNKHNQDINALIRPMLDGFDMGLLSDCGLPAVADPGAVVVKVAHANGFEIIPLVGPSSLMLALMASGVNGQSFAFTGYLPIDNQEREQQILRLQELIVKYKQSQIIIETPFRNQQLLKSLINALNKDVILCVAINLMQHNQHIISQTIAKWKQLSILPEIHKQEAVFVIGI